VSAPADGPGETAGLPRPIVAIVGRPNVGKSTLVNRLAGGRPAITEETPGVTRDRTTHLVEWRGRDVTVIDTGGWLAAERGTDPLASAVSAQAEQAVAGADVVVLVVDATGAPTDEDLAAARWLRRSANAPVMLAANKADRLADLRQPEVELAEWHVLGLGEALPVSGLHGTGSGDLLDALFAAAGDLGEEQRSAPRPPAVAVVGRPNVGKSSLLNAMAASQRAVVDERPGTTRDAVDSLITGPDGTVYRFVDTAGLRRPAKVRAGASTEYYASVRTAAAIEAADVVLLVLDAAEPIGEQDQKLARQIVDAGRALVLVANQWDRVDVERQEAFDAERRRQLGFVDFAELIRTSAATGRGLQRVLPAADRALAGWSQRVPTSQLNAWLADAVAATPPPLQGQRPVRLRYATQPRVCPPRVVVFGNAEIPEPYRRYLERTLRERFGFNGSPIEVGMRVRPRWEHRRT
jgi:GTP-binding protein